MAKPDDKFFENAVYLVDASSYIFRAYYAIQAPLKAPDGTPTHATYGFLQMLLSLEKEYKAHEAILIWDRPEKGFRHEVYPEYKANRQAAPEDLGVQIQNSKKGATLLGYSQLELPGYEADDLIASVTEKFSDHNFVIVTADKDLLQLVGPNVWCLDTMKKKWSNRDEAIEKFGVEPAKINEIQALSGDSVDNIPGAPGVGPKTATELINFYGSLDKLLAAAQERYSQGTTPPKGDPLKGKRIEALALNIDLIRISHKLVSLHREVPLEINLSDLKKNPIDRVALKEWAQNLGLTRLVTLAMSEPAAESAAAAPAVAQERNFKTRAIESLDELKKILAANESAQYLALDTETFDLQSRRPGTLVGISFAFSEDMGYYLPLRHRDGKNVEVEGAIQELDRYFKSRGQDFALVFQNAKFDLHVLGSERLLSPRNLRIEDTMVQSFVLDASESHGMDALSAKYLGYQTLSFSELIKTHDADNFSEVPIDAAAFYSGEDAVVTLQLWHKLSALLKERQLWKVYDGLDRPLVLLLTQMEETGVGLDPAPLRKLSEQLHKELVDKELQARKSLEDSGVEIPPDFNIASTKQVADILYEKLKLPVLKRGKTGPSTDFKVLEELKDMHPFCGALVEIRELSKLLSTYVDSLPEMVDPIDQRLHTDFSQVIAATGRLSSSGPNLQNIPIRTERGRKIRDAFCAGPGMKLVGVDYSQVELRLVAGLSGDEALIKAFREGADIHRRTAALVLDKDEKDVTDDDRRMAKAINFGIIYGQSAHGLSKTLHISRAEAQRFIDGYFKTYPKIREYIDSNISEAKLHGESRCLTGRRRPLSDIHSKNGILRQFAERMAINSPVQGLAADWMKAAMIRVQERLLKEMPDVKFVMQVHDELLFEVPDSQTEALRKLAVEVMEDDTLLHDFGIRQFPVKMKTDSGMGQHWGEL